MPRTALRDPAWKYCEDYPQRDGYVSCLLCKAQVSIGPSKKSQTILQETHQKQGYESNFELIMLRKNFEITINFPNSGKKFRFRTSTRTATPPLIKVDGKQKCLKFFMKFLERKYLRGKLHAVKLCYS